MMALGQESTKFSLSNCLTTTPWFEKFSKGCLHRMGQDADHDLAISSLLSSLEAEWL
jgi:hypothetical protein